MSNRACAHAVTYAYQYLDEEITWYRKVRIRRHLRKCLHCGGAFAFESRLKAIIRDRGADDAPPELVERLRALIEEERPESSGPR